MSVPGASPRPSETAGPRRDSTPRATVTGMAIWRASARGGLRAVAEEHAGAEAERRDQEQPQRSPDSTSLVGAVESMRADVRSLARAVAASPDAVASRLDVDGAAAAVARRVDNLGSGLVQLRLSLLASLERTEARLDEPPWLTPLQTTLAELSGGARPDASTSLAADDLSEGLAVLEFAIGTVASDVRLLVERMGPLPDRVAAMAAQIDRITPLARSAGDDVLASGPPPRPEGLEDVVKFQAVLDMLAGVIRRQDQVATAVASVLDQLNGPTGVVAAITRMAQRERTVDLGLDRINAGPTARSDGPESRAVEVTRTAVDRVSAAVLKALELQEEAFARRLDRLNAAIRALADQARPVAPVPVPGPKLESVLQRLDQQERAISSRLEWVGDRLAEVAVRPVAAEEAATEPAEPTGLGSAALERLDAVRDAVRVLARHQKALTANLARLVAHSPPPAPDPSVLAVGPQLDALRHAVTVLARRQKALTANVARLVVQIPPPPDPSASTVAAPSLEELREKRVRVQVRLEEERLLAAQGWRGDPLDDPLDEDFDEDFDDGAAPL